MPKNQTELPQTTLLPTAQISPNTGQIPNVPKNPRIIKDAKFDALKTSLLNDPAFFELRPCMVYLHEGKYVIIGGNMRYRAAKELGYKEMPCIIIPAIATTEQLRQRILTDNSDFGAYDFDVLANEFDASEFEFAGIDLWNDNGENDKGYSNKNKEIDTDDFSEKMTLKLEYSETEYHKVKNQLSELGITAESALYKSLFPNDKF